MNNLNERIHETKLLNIISNTGNVKLLTYIFLFVNLNNFKLCFIIFIFELFEI
jgi:hypothetical protein